MRKTIISYEQEDLKHLHLIFTTFGIPNKDFDLKAAIKAAALEFCQTENGKAVYRYNGESFNIGDFVSEVPNYICAKHGFVICGSDLPDEIWLLNEQLVDEYDVFGDEEEADEE